MKIESTIRHRREDETDWLASVWWFSEQFKIVGLLGEHAAAEIHVRSYLGLVLESDLEAPLSTLSVASDHIRFIVYAHQHSLITDLIALISTV